MKAFALALLILPISTNCFAENNKQDNRFSMGLGLGSMYAGVGANIAYISESDLKYISAGCIGYRTRNGYICGFGLGWIKTDLFGAGSNKHGVGVYATLVDHENYLSYTTTDQGTIYKKNENDIYGLGFSYTYFLNGISNSGWTFGVSSYVSNAEVSGKFGSILQTGYQF